MIAVVLIFIFGVIVGAMAVIVIALVTAGKEEDVEETEEAARGCPGEAAGHGRKV